MIPSLSQEELTQYASNAQTIQEPTGLDYSQGARAGRTIPAKWWNWLFSNATKRIVQSRNDADNMLTEMKNVVIDAGLTPSSDDNTQLEQAFNIKTNRQIERFVDNKKNWGRYWEQAQLIVDNVAYDVSTMQVTQHIIYGDNVIVGAFGAQGLTSNWRYSFDGVHWTTIQGLPASEQTNDTMPVFAQGTLFILHTQGTGNTSFPASLQVYHKNLATTDAAVKIIELDNDTLGNHYDCLCTVINDELYIMTFKGELIKLTDCSGTYTTVQAVTGLGQYYFPSGYIYATFAEAHHFNNKFYVGNIEVSEDALSWVPLYNASSRADNASNIYVKQLSSGCIAFVDSNSETAVILDNAHELINLPAGYRVNKSDRNVDTFLDINNHGILYITYDGVNFIHCVHRVSAAVEYVLTILGEADGVTYAISGVGYGHSSSNIFAVQGAITQNFEGAVIIGSFSHESNFLSFRDYAYAIPDSSIVVFAFETPENEFQNILLSKTAQNGLPVVKLLSGDTQLFIQDGVSGYPIKHKSGPKNYGVVGAQLYVRIGHYNSSNTHRGFMRTSRAVNTVVGHTLYLR